MKITSLNKYINKFFPLNNEVFFFIIITKKVKINVHRVQKIMTQKYEEMNDTYDE